MSVVCCLMPAYRTTNICHVRWANSSFQEPVLGDGHNNKGNKLTTKHSMIRLELPKAANVDMCLKLYSPSSELSP